jgi:hypothetical protein
MPLGYRYMGGGAAFPAAGDYELVGFSLEQLRGRGDGGTEALIDQGCTPGNLPEGAVFCNGMAIDGRGRLQSIESVDPGALFKIAAVLRREPAFYQAEILFTEVKRAAAGSARSRELHGHFVYHERRDAWLRGPVLPALTPAEGQTLVEGLKKQRLLPPEYFWFVSPPQSGELRAAIRPDAITGIGIARAV